MAQKTDPNFSIYGRNGIIQWHFFLILTWAIQGCWGQMTIDVEFWGYDLKFFFAKSEPMAANLENVS